MDCSGFTRILSESSGWEDYTRYLPVNRVSHSEPLMRRNEYTVAEAWIMGGHGRYQPVKRLVEDMFTVMNLTDVEQEIENRYGQVEWGKEISFRSGRLEKFVNKNCVSIGLINIFRTTSGITSIHCTLVQLELFVQEFMSDVRLLEDDFLAQKYNDMVVKIYDDMRDFMALHYTGGKSDTEFWLHCETMDKPDRVKSYSLSGTRH